MFSCFQALEAEIIAHEPLVENVATTAQKLIDNQHYASQDISKQTQEMKTSWVQLKDDTAKRKIKLLDAMESQMVSSLFFISQMLDLLTYYESVFFCQCQF